MATLEQIAEALKKADAAGNSEDAAKLAAAYRQMRDAGGAQTEPPTPVDFVSQGMSGLNEGIATGLGFPVELATAGINLATTGINKLTGSDIPQIEHPVGGVGTFRSILSPTIKPESEDPALKATRRVTQELGAWAVPGGGIAAKTLKPVQTIAKELPAVLGSGAGAATAQQLAPDNPLAEFAGQIVGSMTPGGATRALSKEPKVSIDDLYAQKDKAYKAVSNAGASFQPQQYDQMLVDLVQRAKGDHISPTRHESAYSFINDMIGRRNGKPMTLTELDQLRQEVRRDLIKPAWTNDKAAADAHFGEMIVDAIDDMIATNATGSPLINAARQAHSRLRKTELIEDAIVRAQRRVDSTGSGGNINNAIRQNLRAILDSKTKSKGFTPDELAELEKVVRQGGLENILRLVGKLSPSGNGLSAWFGIGAASQGYGALPIAGLIAKALADKGTIRKAAELQSKIAGRPAVKRAPPVPSPALTYAQSANQMQNDGPIEITVRGGAR